MGIHKVELTDKQENDLKRLAEENGLSLERYIQTAIAFFSSYINDAGRRCREKRFDLYDIVGKLSEKELDEYIKLTVLNGIREKMQDDE